MSNIDKQTLKPVGKFAFESVGARWHHVKHGEAQITLPKLPLMRLYAEDDVQALLDELEAAEKRIAELEAREVKLPKPISVLHRRDFADAHRSIYAYPEAEVNAALSDAGIRIHGED
ncbi:TPA: hypothetical protein ACOEP6_002126 [Enterobacter ludwigii]